MEYITIPLGWLTEDTQFVKVAISLPELVQQTNAFSVKNRPGCVATLLDSDPKQLFLHYNVKCKEKTSDPLGHDVRVKFDVSKVEMTQKANDLDIQVSCACKAFLYWGAQWNLHERDGLLGEPRPKLQAPTQQLDLRSNFVICKHCKTVFERILPSVQHNIVKIIRERTVLKNKEKEQVVNPKLQKKLDEMKKRQEEKGKGKNNKQIQEKLLEALRQRDAVPAEEEGVVTRDGDATDIKDKNIPVLETPKIEELPEKSPAMPSDLKSEPEDITDLLAKEENKLNKQQEKQHEHMHKEPHLHSGLPYEVEEEKTEHHHKTPTDRELMDVLKKKQKKPNEMKQFTDQKYQRRRSSLEDSLLASLAEEETDEEC